MFLQCASQQCACAERENKHGKQQSWVTMMMMTMTWQCVFSFSPRNQKDWQLHYWNLQKNLIPPRFLPHGCCRSHFNMPQHRTTTRNIIISLTKNTNKCFIQTLQYYGDILKKKGNGGKEGKRGGTFTYWIWLLFTSFHHPFVIKLMCIIYPSLDLHHTNNILHKRSMLKIYIAHTLLSICPSIPTHLLYVSAHFLAQNSTHPLTNSNCIQTSLYYT